VQEPCKGATGKETTLRDTIVTTIPGSSAYVGRASQYTVKAPGFHVDLRDHNAASGHFGFVAEPVGGVSPRCARRRGPVSSPGASALHFGRASEVTNARPRRCTPSWTGVGDIGVVAPRAGRGYHMSVRATLRRALPNRVGRELRRGRDALAELLDRWLAREATLVTALQRLGVRPGGILFVQMSYDQLRRFRVAPVRVIDLLTDVIGPAGTLVMPTFPFRGSSQAYLETSPTFDARRTPSTSGLVSEVFRRMPGTERSLHPTHSVAARGPDARWLTEGHALSSTPFDATSPFARMLERHAQILTLGRFRAMTFRHLADHLMTDAIPLPIYADRPSTVTVVAPDGGRRLVTTVGHNPRITCDPGIVIDELVRRGRARRLTVRRLPLLCVSSRDYVETYRDAYARGLFRYELRTSALVGDDAANAAG
jgi:aminoglycoside 3-N-acetyltransferase